MRDHQLDVLVVDDGDDFLLLWRLLLNGHPRIGRIREARTGDEAIEEMQLRGPADVVLADVWMSHGSGYDIAEHVRSTWPATAVVLTSCAEGLQREALERGATTFIKKERTVGADVGDLLCAVADGATQPAPAA